MNTQEQIPESIKASGRKLPFTVPDTYFNEFPGKIQARLSQDEKPVIVARFIHSKLAIAAMFIGFLALGYAGIRILLNNGNSDFVSEDLIIETIEYFSYELDNELLASAVIDSDIPLDLESEDSQTEELIQYLSEDDIDFSYLLNDN